MERFTVAAIGRRWRSSISYSTCAETFDELVCREERLEAGTDADDDRDEGSSSASIIPGSGSERRRSFRLRSARGSCRSFFFLFVVFLFMTVVGALQQQKMDISKSRRVSVVQE